MEATHWLRYRFESTWRLNAAPEIVYAILADPVEYPTWWPSVRSVTPLTKNSGLVVCRSTLPYLLRFTATSEVKEDDAMVLRAALTGDLDGWSGWRVHASGDQTLAAFTQEVTVQGFLRRLPAVLRPLLEWNHAQMMRAGGRGMRRLLATKSVPAGGADRPRSATRWAEIAGGSAGVDYVARLAEREASGMAMHGEADLCQQWLERLGVSHGRVLDAGCGTGRVAIELTRRGAQVVGVDADDSMLAQARRVVPEMDWRQLDLAALPPGFEAEAFDLAVCAGNVLPLLAPGTLGSILVTLAGSLKPGGVLISGFGLDREHLPPGCPVTGLAEVNTAAHDADLSLLATYSTWVGDPFDGGGYAVTVHQKACTRLSTPRPLSPR